MRSIDRNIWQARRSDISISIVVGALIGYALVALGVGIYCTLVVIETLGPTAITSAGTEAVVSFDHAAPNLERSASLPTNGPAVATGTVE